MQFYRLDDYTPYSAVLQYLENTIIKLLATRPACLLLPSTWPKYGPLLHNLAEKRNHPQITQAVKKLEQRNNRLLACPKQVTFTSKTSAGRVYRILDSVDFKRAVRIE